VLPTWYSSEGTLFTDDEIIEAGLGEKTDRRMGHVLIRGPGRTLERLSDLRACRILLRINSSNSFLLADLPERRHSETVGFEVVRDGMEVRL
jgi:pyrroloquinoline quinone biosynthesis protein B